MKGPYVPIEGSPVSFPADKTPKGSEYIYRDGKKYVLIDGKECEVKFDQVLFRGPDSKDTERLVNIAKRMAELYSRKPAFRKTSEVDLGVFLVNFVINLSPDGEYNIVTEIEDPATRTQKVIFSFDYDRICFDLASAAYERFVLHAHDSDEL